VFFAVLVFISYSRSDSAAVHSLAADLARAGCTVEYDRDVRAGEEWTSRIEAMIDRADIVFVVLGARKPSLWVRGEYLRALNKRRRVVPVRLSAGVDIPLPLDAMATVQSSQEAVVAAGCSTITVDPTSGSRIPADRSNSSPRE
jgi:hypothetical protein